MSGLIKINCEKKINDWPMELLKEEETKLKDLKHSQPIHMVKK